MLCFWVDGWVIQVLGTSKVAGGQALACGALQRGSAQEVEPPSDLSSGLTVSMKRMRS